MNTRREGYRFWAAGREKLNIIVFGTDTPAGRRFDVWLLWIIMVSILAVVLESVRELNVAYGNVFTLLEWGFTLFFTVEYLLRLFISRKPLGYAWSFFGLVDLIAIIPTYLTLFFSGGSYLVVIRAIRLLRVFRILKLSRQLSEAQLLGRALVASRYKIMVFMGGVSALVLIMGTLMYMIEGGENGFTSIPQSIYWAVVTITTVGYGDIAPQTVLGQGFAAILMLMGYAIIAVPTGIVTAELTAEEMKKRKTKVSKNVTCINCESYDHDESSLYCKHCGSKLRE
ncbi:MAG: ion transporter [Cyclobacteriaceae bacterium]|nr:ion transporter [Cyclobacteriaceae bacterium]